jgi:DNA-binding response OmpR family regulator
MFGPESSPPLRALVVDSAADYTDCLTHLLRLWGYEPAAAYDGAEALAVAARFRPDVVLLGLDGCEVARCLRRLPGLETVVVIALTDCGEEPRPRSEPQGLNLLVIDATDAGALRAVLGALAREKAKRGEEADDPVPIVRWHSDPC